MNLEVVLHCPPGVMSRLRYRDELERTCELEETSSAHPQCSGHTGSSLILSFSETSWFLGENHRKKSSITEITSDATGSLLLPTSRALNMISENSGERLCLCGETPILVCLHPSHLPFQPPKHGYSSFLY